MANPNQCAEVTDPRPRHDTRAPSARTRPTVASPLLRGTIRGFTITSKFSKDPLGDARCGPGDRLSATGKHPAVMAGQLIARITPPPPP